MDLQVNNISIKHNIWYNISDLSTLQILWPIVDNIYYTLIIHNVATGFVNSMLINIPGNNIVKGLPLIPYVVPNPPNGQYNYRISLFQQLSLINCEQVNNGWFGPKFNFNDLKDRKKDTVAKFIFQYQLLILGTETLVVNGDHKLYYRSTNNEIKHDPIPVNNNFDSLGISGLDEQLNGFVENVIAPRFMSKEFKEKLGIKDVRGALLYGPPGTGKTLIARNIGGLIPDSVISNVNGPELSSQWVGETEANIRKLFENARKTPQKIHVIIFDEIDAVGKRRTNNSLTHTADNALTQLLTMIDGLNSPKNVLVIGITNRKDVLDPALLRSGRLEYQVEIPLPNETARKKIMDLYLQPLVKQGLVGDINTDKWANKLDKYSGADIENLVNKSKNIMIMRNLNLNNKPVEAPSEGKFIPSIICDDDLEEAYNIVKPLPSDTSTDNEITSKLKDLLQI